MLSKLLRLGAAGVMSLSLGAFGVVGAVSGTIDTTGPDSTNEVFSEVILETEVDNETDIEAQNNNPQNAHTGHADVRHNTTGGHAESGAAANDSLLRASVEVDNTACGCDGVEMDLGELDAEIENTGPGSENVVESTTEVSMSVDNDTYIGIQNNNSQTATTGNAVVEGNTTGGNALTGDASNIGTVELEFSVAN